MFTKKHAADLLRQIELASGELATMQRKAEADERTTDGELAVLCRVQDALEACNFFVEAHFQLHEACDVIAQKAVTA